ncbi:MAG: hypothetical protein IT165_11365 [Bryobacterales bacterium]|nr:hypothetical protein [Bryobacterales bacterium]
MAALLEDALSTLDETASLLDHSPFSAQTASALEHVQSARISLLGGMPLEFLLNVRMLRDAVERIPDAPTRESAAHMLERLPRE